MIPLSIPCDIVGEASQPFIARLSAPGDQEGTDRAILTGEEGGKRFYQLGACTIHIELGHTDTALGDILYFDPDRQRAERWIRANSDHNTLLVTEQCDQLCVMCSQPPKKSHTDQFVLFEKACRLSPPHKLIGLSGGEPLLHKSKLFSMLRRLHDVRPDLSFHVLTNGQHFTDDDLPLLKQLNRVCWGIPLYAATATLHDKLVGKIGAFETLFQTMSLLARAGSAIELRTVLMRPNATELEALARLIADALPFIDVWAVMQLENIGYARNNWNNLFYDHSQNFVPIGAALAIALLRGIDVALYNFPRCTLPNAWRAYAPRTISDWKSRFPTKCTGCREQSDCAGFFEWHPDDKSYERITPL